jgi:hypothetical protein
VTTLRQPTLPDMRQANNVRHKVADDYVYMMLASGIPMEKVFCVFFWDNFILVAVSISGGSLGSAGMVEEVH